MTPERWQQVKEVLAAALEREPVKRAAYLDQVCAEPSLRREVESLIAAHEQGDGSFMEHPAVHSGTLKTGTKLGTYEILAALGAGGMGEVYQAHDSKLRRDVAIKVLPAAFVHDADRLSRFQREARMLASLNHTNIATIFGLEQSDGAIYLVMELVLGQTLAERVSAGPVPIKEALAIGSQIAEALEAAHEKGVIHRDLKPANVKLTPEGKVKVLDFGLAKAFANDGGLDLTQSPTLTGMASEEGRILGTPAYMSPEQARGKPVDKRTDIWAFGCVLYELLAGRQAFRGETLSDTIAAILEREPDWQALPVATPAKIRDLLRRCLQKDAQRRLRDVGDARIEIEEAMAVPSRAEPTGIAGNDIRVLRPGTLLWVGASLLLAAIAGVAVWNLKPRPSLSPKTVSRLTIALPPGQQLAGLDLGSPVALSHDGTHLAYVARQGGVQQLYLRALDSQDASPVSGTQGAFTPFFSPDDQWLVFFADGKLKKISVNGGLALILCDVRLPSGASWGNRNTIAFGNFGGPILQVSDAGGKVQPLTHFDNGDTGQIWPEFLPGGKSVLFATEQNALIVQSLPGERRKLVEGGTNPHYAASGHLVYTKGSSLMAVAFDLQRLEIKGTPVPVVENVAESPTYNASQYSMSDTGALVYISGGSQPIQRRMVWVSRNGTEQSLPAPPESYRYARLSPDGRRVAAELDKQIWVYDLARDTFARLTFEGNLNESPVWTPDGMRIAFFSDKAAGEYNIWSQLADGSGGLERLTTSDYSNVPASFSPDGKLLAYTENNPKSQKDIWVLRLNDRKAQLFLQTPFIEANPVFSPDGRWIAYVSNESSRPEIYVQPYPGPGGKWQISTEGGTEPTWNRNGRELFFRSGDKMMSVDVATQRGFSAGKPGQLFEGPYVTNDWPLTSPTYDVSVDGQRFLMIKPAEQASPATQINVVLNWFEELKQKVPTGKK